MQEEFDIIHDHTMPLSLPVANIARVPVVGTNHGGVTEATRDLFVQLSRPYIVSISRSQVETLPDVNHAGVVYNGLPLAHYPFAKDHKGYLLFVGRICEEKGTHYAIQVARELGMPLIIAGKVDAVDEVYFRELVKPHLTGTIEWVGEVDERARNKLMCEAECMLQPVTWMEPFGLVLIEAAACGCPVIAFDRGSIPEVVVDGATGFVVKTIAQMKKAVTRVASIDREVCRTHALTNFSDVRMADGYERVYERILAQHASARRPHAFITEPVFMK
jgi:glycosyltransferase involved in cell wall biosynthesis